MARAFAWASTQYLENGAALVSAYPVSMACWFKLASKPTREQPLMFSLRTGNADMIGLNATNPSSSVHNLSAQESGATVAANDATDLQTGTWYQAVGVFASQTSRSVYLNGAKTSNATDSTGFPSPLDRFRIGGNAFIKTVTQYLDGTVAEAAVWTAALTDDEAIALSKGFDPRLIRPASLLAYWPLFGNESPEPDRWRVGTNLTLVNTPTKADHTRMFYRE